jgi:hypothetical protein
LREAVQRGRRSTAGGAAFFELRVGGNEKAARQMMRVYTRADGRGGSPNSSVGPSPVMVQFVVSAWLALGNVKRAARYARIARLNDDPGSPAESVSPEVRGVIGSRRAFRLVRSLELGKTKAGEMRRMMHGGIFDWTNNMLSLRG